MIFLKFWAKCTVNEISHQQWSFKEHSTSFLWITIPEKWEPLGLVGTQATPQIKHKGAIWSYICESRKPTLPGKKMAQFTRRSPCVESAESASRRYMLSLNLEPMISSISHILVLVDPEQGWNSRPGRQGLCRENVVSLASQIPPYFRCMKNLKRETLKKIK